MSQFVIYIALEKYLAEWLTNHFGNPAVFPPQSNANAVIRAFVGKLPEGTLPELNDGSKVAIALPDSKAKPPSVYNYMGAAGKKAVKEVIKDLFCRNLWADMTPLENTPVGINTRIAAWCEMHGIGLDRVETVRQCYYRMRDSHSKHGVNLKNIGKKDWQDHQNPEN